MADKEKMMKLFLTILLFLGVQTQADLFSVTQSLEIDSESTFYREGDYLFGYKVIEFKTGETELLTFESENSDLFASFGEQSWQSDDPYLYIYEGEFDPSDPEGWLYEDDDGGEDLDFYLEADLSPNTIYSAVITTYNPQEFGTVDVTITGDDFMIIPEPASMLLIGLGSGLLLITRKRD